MRVAFVYATPQVASTGLSHNAAECAALLTAHGIEAAPVRLDEIGVWDDWLIREQPEAVVLAATCLRYDDLNTLSKKFPRVLWVQRIHSNMAWLFSCVDECSNALRVIHLANCRKNVVYSVVDPCEAARWQSAGARVMGIPNVWTAPITDKPRTYTTDTEWLHLSAIFALRLLKHPAGHVLTAAILDRVRPVKLHVQPHRTDCRAYPDLLGRVANLLNVRMPLEPYRPHEAFVEWLAGTIDVGLQLSLTESFNYVTFEHLALGIPCVTSRAVLFSPWRVDVEDAEAAAASVLDICRNYRAASSLALEAARAVRERNNADFLEAISSLLKGQLT
jgi:glycosyltransferase involved in cell wall biosynthesis